VVKAKSGARSGALKGRDEIGGGQIVRSKPARLIGEASEHRGEEDGDEY
jgi:hypothetical protein